MKLRSKLIGINVFGQIVFAIIFFSAVYFSYTNISERLYITSLIDRYADDALDTYIILHLAESGDELGTKESLNLKVDNYIYELNQLAMISKNESEKSKVAVLLQKIAKHRQSYPRDAMNILQKEVDAILEAHNNR